MFRNLLLMALPVLVQGCQPPAAGTPDRAPVPALAPVLDPGQARQLEDGIPVVVSLSFWGVGVTRERGVVGGAASAFYGTLSQSGGCLIVTSGDGTKVQPVFPAGKAAWDATAQILTVGQKRYSLGERIMLGGGGVASAASYSRETGVQITKCEVSELFVVAG